MKHLSKALLMKLMVSLNITLWSLFFIVFWSYGYLFKADGSVWAQSLGTWADGAAHLTYISSMAFRIPTQLPVYAGKAFVYPFVADGLSALLVRMGMNIFVSYMAVGVVFSVVFIFILFLFYKLLLKSAIKAIVALNIFLLSGGVGFIKFFKDLTNNGWSVLTAIPQEYTLIDEWTIRWINIVTAELIPQRAFLLALPLGLIVCVWLWRRLQLQKNPWWLTMLVSLILGVMPLIHVHTYMVFGVVTAWILCVDLWRQRKDLLSKTGMETSFDWLVVGSISVSLSLSIILFHILPAADRSYLQWWPGWLAHSNNINWLWWWFVNTGLFLPLSIIGWLRSSRDLRIFSFGFVIVFVLANLWIFQPYDWDNAKLLTWVFLMFAPLVTIALTRFYTSHWVTRILAVVLFISLTLTGFIDVVRQLQPHTRIHMYSSEDLELVDWIKENTPTDAIFLTGQSHTHPVPSLTGRQVLLGYTGWVWSYGIESRPREAEVITMFQSGDQELIRQNNIDYIVIGPDERNRFQVTTKLLSEYPTVYESAHYKVLKVE